MKIVSSKPLERSVTSLARSVTRLERLVTSPERSVASMARSVRSPEPLCDVPGTLSDLPSWTLCNVPGTPRDVPGTLPDLSLVSVGTDWATTALQRMPAPLSVVHDATGANPPSPKRSARRNGRRTLLILARLLHLQCNQQSDAQQPMLVSRNYLYCATKGAIRWTERSSYCVCLMIDL